MLMLSSLINYTLIFLRQIAMELETGNFNETKILKHAEDETFEDLGECVSKTKNFDEIDFKNSMLPL